MYFLIAKLCNYYLTKTIKEIRIQSKKIRPQVNAEIIVPEEKNTNKMIIKISNVGNVSVKGIAYIVINKASDDKNIRDCKLMKNFFAGGLEKAEFKNFWFSKINFKLNLDESPHIYRYSPNKFLENLAGEQQIRHIVRIEVCYWDKFLPENKYYDTNFFDVQYYEDWNISRLGVNATFRPYVSSEEISYEEYKKDMKH